MKVRCLQSTWINTTFRAGPEFNDKDEKIADGEVFDVPDNFEVNPEVLEVVTPPSSGKVRYASRRQPVAVGGGDDAFKAPAVGGGGGGKGQGKGKKEPREPVDDGGGSGKGAPEVK